MSEVPYYLNPVASQDQGLLFNIPIYSQPSMGGVTYTPETIGGVWADLAKSAGDMVGDTTDYVFDAASNSWKSVKDAVKETVSDVTSVASGYFDWVKSQLLWVLAILAAAIFVLAKSGILKDAADLTRAVMGG